MQVSRQEHRTQAYVLTEEDLNTLVSGLETIVGKVRFEARCADFLTRLLQPHHASRDRQQASDFVEYLQRASIERAIHLEVFSCCR